jgi:hypothetical protein
MLSVLKFLEMVCAVISLNALTLFYEENICDLEKTLSQMMLSYIYSLTKCKIR